MLCCVMLCYVMLCELVFIAGMFYHNACIMLTSIVSKIEINVIINIAVQVKLF